MNANDPIWLTPAQAAPLLGMHPKTVRDMCAAKQITCRWNGIDGKGARYRLTRAHVDAWIHAHTVYPRKAS